MFLQDEHSLIPNLVRIVFPYGTRNGIIAMFVAYFDESGTQRGSPVVAVAGFLAPVKQWERFQAEWARVLQQEGLSFFHATDWENRQGQFKGWDNDQRIAVYKKLTGIIQRRITIPVLTAVNTADYAEAKLWEMVQEDFPRNPYGFCALVCMQIIGNWADQVKYNGPIAYVFEDGAAHRTELTTSLRDILRDDVNKRRFRFISSTYADKRAFTPLQAADILAYEACKDMRNQTVDGHVRRQRVSYRALLDGIRGSWLNYKSCRFFSKEHFFNFKQDLKHGKLPRRSAWQN